MDDPSGVKQKLGVKVKKKENINILTSYLKCLKFSGRYLSLSPLQMGRVVQDAL